MSYQEVTSLGMIADHPILSQTKAQDFEGPGGPEEKQARTAYQRPGDQNVPNFLEQGQ